MLRFTKEEIASRILPSHIEHLVRNISGNPMAKLGRPNAAGYASIQCCFHEDRNPSLRVNVAQGGGYICYGCGATGDFFHLVSHASGASTFPEQIEKAADLVGLTGFASLNTGWYSFPTEPKHFPVAKPQYDLDHPEMFPALGDKEAVCANEMIARLDQPVLEYLHGPKRRLIDKTIKDWKIGWHPGARRVSIPQYDALGRLVNISGRYIPSVFDEWDPPPWLHATGFLKTLFLFGEDRIDRSLGYVVLVEGMFDAIYLHQAGVSNVVAMLGSKISSYQEEKICRWAKRLIIVPDGDEPGARAADFVEKRLADRIEIKRFSTPEGKDPDCLTEAEVAEVQFLIV